MFAKVRRTSSEIIALPFAVLFNRSLDVDILPDCLRLALVIPIHKKEMLRDEILSYKLVTLLPSI